MVGNLRALLVRELSGEFPNQIDKAVCTVF
jgi:hypothetical protein